MASSHHDINICHAERHACHRKNRSRASIGYPIMDFLKLTLAEPDKLARLLYTVLVWYSNNNFLWVKLQKEAKKEPYNNGHRCFKWNSINLFLHLTQYH